MNLKYPIVRQHNTEDCGAACLATIAKYYGKILSITRSREATGTGQLGVTLLNLKQGAKVLGFNARGVKASLELVDQKILPLPGVIHWQGNHWVVLYGIAGKKYVIADPAAGIRYLGKEELIAAWNNGVMLLLEPRPEFYQLPEDEEKVKGLWRLVGRISSYRTTIIEVLILNLANGVLAIASPFLLQILTDDVLIRGDRNLLTGVALAVLLLNFISITLKFIQSNLIAHFAQRLELDLILEFGRAILGLPLAYYESRRSGEVSSRLRDIQDINLLIAQGGIILPSQFFVALVSLVLMFFYSWQLTTLPIFFALLMIIFTIIILPRFEKILRKLLVLTAENQGILVETFKGAIVLKSTNSAPALWEEFQIRYGQQAALSFRALQMGIINNTFSELLSRNGIIILLWLGSILVINQELSIGQLLAFNSMSSNFLILIITILNFISPFTRVQIATQRVTEVIDATPETVENQPKEWGKISANGDIICTNLNFHHPGRIDLLKDFSVVIPGGKVIAIIGESGCGKSTLAKLIAGLYQLDSGNISYGIYHQNDLAKNCLRKQAVLVAQDAHFWSRSIVANFRLVEPQISFEEIIKACRIAQADEFINKLPDKYQTVLGEFGANISGGQKQRLAIARGIISEPPILILDESTSALDPVSESKVLDNLLAHRQGKTTIMISHRPRVIQRADWIIFLENGAVKLQGLNSDLLSLNGDHLQFLIP
ncbi:MAG: peptidase domain-containing ABC transporter [Gomphosphaeria aponina SAG 52.96 = DSM 107014]|uniref:Peptidase domain-containing ABC transporter n=1 Tax=Gomphosphaeria aponina SAG 52.96 = DSM 107014 TaxID=1521640 RepID=A0A941JT36_9CHRO|nr:peptidase domain-containing ABC transporter [Gomphosphaeria aponina SAG 52.96 = DSM 107014]